MRPLTSATTAPVDVSSMPDADNDNDETSQTRPYLRAIFLGVPIPPYAADRALPAHLSASSIDATIREVPVRR